MALLTSELQRCKFELGYNLLGLSALPYAFDGITQIFEQIVGPYLQAGALTYSSTPVAGVAVGSPAALVALTVTSPTGISVGDRVVIDQDATQEIVHVSAISGSVVTVALLNAHQGTYPVSVEGGESIVREKLRECVKISQKISSASGFVGLKRAEEVEWYSTAGTQLGLRDELLALQRYWRGELASALGVANLREARANGGQMLENY